MERAIQKSIRNYFIYGPRSSKKLNMLHDYIGRSIVEKISTDGYAYDSLPRKETNVVGKFYKKNIDVGIRNEDSLRGIVSVKFIMSNFCQNSNNYFENLIGEMYNLKDVAPRMYVMIIFDDIPYYDNKKEIVKYEKMKNLEKYDELVCSDILSNFIIIKVSNGKSLIHPSKVRGIPDCSVFKIVSEYPQSYENCIGQFSQKLKSKIPVE